MVLLPNISGAPFIIQDPKLPTHCGTGSAGSRAGC